MTQRNRKIASASPRRLKLADDSALLLAAEYWTALRDAEQADEAATRATEEATRAADEARGIWHKAWDIEANAALTPATTLAGAVAKLAIASEALRLSLGRRPQDPPEDVQERILASVLDDFARLGVKEPSAIAAVEADVKQLQLRPSR